MKLSSGSLFFTIILFTLMFSTSVFTQDAPIKWGDIPKDDIEMKSWPSDTNASAVILCDYGTSDFNDDMQISFKRHARIKILTEKGYQFGTEDIILYTGEEGEAIYGIEGVTYIPGPDGTVSKKTLSSKDIFEEKVDKNHKRVKFVLPGLTPGCVIEFRYEITSGDLFHIRSWEFQYDEPARRSEYHVTVPARFSYSTVTNGCERFTMSDMEDVERVFSGETSSFLQDRLANCKLMKYAMEDVPALHEEPFTTTIEDYRDRVEFQLSAYVVPGQGVKHVLNTWEKLVSELLDNKEFGGQIDNTKAMRKVVDGLTAGKTAPEDKLIAIYSWVAKSIVKTGGNSVFAQQEINDVIDTKTGKNSEIAFLLISMLRYAGISADPVLLSTRGNGKIQNFYPMVNQFNYVLTRAKIGDKNYFLDATDPGRPFDMLPTKVLGVSGLVIKPEPIEWVTIPSIKKYLETTATTITVNPDGSFTGEMLDVLQQYGALFNRDEIKTKKEIELAKAFLETEKSGIQIDSVAITGKDSIELPFSVYAKISSSSYAQNSGDIIFFNPHLLNRHRANVFKSEHRKFPIDFGYLREYKNAVTIVLPDSFEVKDNLPDRSFTAANGALSYSRQSQIADGRLQILYKYQVRETEIKPEYYNLVRNFYNQIVAGEAEQVVLRHREPVAPKQIVPQVQETVKTSAEAATPEKKSRAVVSKKKGQ